MDAEVWGEMGRDAVQRCGAGGIGSKGAVSFPLLRGKSPFNPLKNPQQLEADHQLGRLMSSTLK